MWHTNKEYILKLENFLPVNCFADETRGFIQDFQDEFKTPLQYVKEGIDDLRNLPNKYEKLIPKWHDQPYYVELWTEKNAMVGTFRSILKDLDVRIVFNRGFDSVSNSWTTYQRIKQKMVTEGKKVRIIYCGDLDPSGDAMDETINQFMKLCFDVEHYRGRGLYNFERIGVLYEHISRFRLPKNPDKDVLAKLKNDPRKEQFKKKYHLKSDDELFQIEIDALAAANPTAFKEMILHAVKKYYDYDIYFNLLRDVKHSKKQIRIHVIKNVNEFVDEFNMKLLWIWLES